MKIITEVSFIFILLIVSLSTVYAQDNDTIPLADSTVVVRDTLTNSLDSTSVKVDSTQKKATQPKLDLKKYGLGGKDKKETQTVADTTKSVGLAQDSVATTQEDSLVVYGIETTQFIYEEDLFRNTYQSRQADSSLTYRQRYSPLQKSGFLYQDLGNLGTAIQSIAYQAPQEIGTRWGVNNFDPYLTKSSDIRYFNTLSPYTSLYVAQGGQGKSYLDILFARNINSNWGFSVWYKRLVANKVVGNRFRRNDTQLTHQTVGYNTRFKSKNGRYKLLSYFQFYQHEILETGGLKLKNGFEELNELYEVQNGELLESLTNVNTIQTGKTLHLYQQYSIFKNDLVNFFHILDYNKEDNKLIDGNVGTNRQFYDSTYFTASKAESFYRTRLQTVKNQLGLKGELANFRYNTYVKVKKYDFLAQFVADTVDMDTTGIATRNLANEWFVGGGLRYVHKENSYIDLAAEYLFDDSLRLVEDTTKRVGDYQISASLVHKNIKISYKTMSYRPDLIQQRFYGNHFKWDNRKAKNTLSQQLNLSYSYFYKDLAVITPFIKYTKIQNYIYYDFSAIAKQDVLGELKYRQVGLEAKVKWKDVRSESKVIYTDNLANQFIPIPKIHVNTLLYHQNPIPHSVLRSQIGLEVHWKSAFSGQDYMPATQQFYLQEDYKIGNYVLLDVFFNFNISKVTISTKINNILDRLSKQGYFETPQYMGKPRTFEINISWLFYD